VSRPTEPGLVSIIVPVFNRWDSLRACLESIQRQSYTAIEVIVVDDGSTLPMPELDLPDGSLHLIRLPRNYGPGHARNRGYRASRGEFLHFLDSDDALASREAVRDAVAFLRSRADVGAIGGEIPAPAGAPPAAEVFGRRVGVLGRSFGVSIAYGDSREARDAAPCDYVASCNLFVRRKDFEAAGGFDPYLGFGGEDLELGRRIAGTQLRTYIGQRWAAYHYGTPGGRAPHAHYRYDLTRIRCTLKSGSLLSRCLVIADAVARALAFYPLLPAKLACYAAMRRPIRPGHLNAGVLLAKALFRGLYELPHTLRRRGTDFLSAEETERFERAVGEGTWVL
jgi:GT2 family glycosyltransferase